MKQVIPFTYFVIAIAACISVFFVCVLQPASAGAFFVITVWLTFPHLIMAAALVLVRRFGGETRHRRIVATHLLAALISVGGILMLIDIMFVSPDAQGAIGVMLTPIYQGCGFAVGLIGLMFLLDS